MVHEALLELSCGIEMSSDTNGEYSKVAEESLAMFSPSVEGVV
jgi:hypothetical protein